MKKQIAIQTTIGPLYLVASENFLHGIFWKKQHVSMLASPSEPPAKIFQQATREIEEYLEGRRTEFEVPLQAEGTDFQRLVWHELAQIPYGETRSYKDIAKRIGNEKACRAVGTANGRNPLSIMIPCHRVIASDKTLGGYAGGLDIKATLLNLEKNDCSRPEKVPGT